MALIWAGAADRIVEKNGILMIDFALDARATGACP